MDSFRGTIVKIDEKGVNGDFEKLLRRFKRRVIKECILYEYNQRQSYKKPSKVRHHRDYVRRCRHRYGRRTKEDMQI